MGLDLLTQAVPVQVQRLAADRVQVFLIGVDRHDALRIGGFIEPRAGTLLFRQLVRGFQQVELNGFKGAVRQVVGAAIGITHAMLGQIVCIVDHANTQRTTAHCAALCRRNRVILIIQQGIQRTDRKGRQLFQIVQAVNRTQVEGRQRTKRDFAVFVVHVQQRLGWQGNFKAQVRLANRGDCRVKRAVGVAVIDVLNIDSAGRSTFLHHQ